MSSESALLREILQNWVSRKSPPASLRELEILALADKLRAKAFGITPENVGEVIQKRSHLFQSLHPKIIEFCQNKGFSNQSVILETLWNLWLPLALKIATYRQNLHHPLIQGILGGQGTGKTTLAAILISILDDLGYPTIALSLDDLYKTYLERQRLKEEDPRLIWRGPPGTHDVSLGIAVLDRLRQGTGSIEIPRFDKSACGGEGDRTRSEIVENIDVVLFEGWFVGVRPIEPTNFDRPLPPIITLADRTFARDMNAKLQDYLPLWERLDRLFVLYPTDYQVSKQWRRQAEQQMVATGKSGMRDEIIDRFVEYFWRSLHPDLFIKPLLGNLNLVDLVIEINIDRSLGMAYCPGDRLT